MAFLSAAFVPARSAYLASFQLAVLGPVFADDDFKAVRTSANQIRNVFGPQDDWPPSDISFQTNLDDLIRHEKEFDDRVAFAYSLLDPEGQRYLGCVYIKPIKSRKEHDRRKALFDAQAFFWLAAEQSILTDAVAERELMTWVAKVFPFSAVAWPGRVPRWDAWAELANS